MSADQALRELLEVSEDVVAAVMVGAKGDPLAATVEDEQARSAAEAAGGMVAYLDALRTGSVVRRVHAVTEDGHVFAVREGDRVVLAVTGPDPVAGLVYHDLGAALRKAGRRTRQKANASA